MQFAKLAEHSLCWILYLQVFGPYVQQWIDSSQDALCHRCKVLEANTFATAVNPDMVMEEGTSMGLL